MKAFRISGMMWVPSEGRWAKFTKDLVAENDEEAVEKTYSIIGSKHGLKRRQIEIKSVEEIAPEDSEDPVVLYHFKRGGE
jgi:large subunit ribosomal protein LX